MKTKEEIKKWLLENCIDENGDLDLRNLDFRDFDGDIYISCMKVKKDLYQGYQAVEGNLYQRGQIVVGDLYQDENDKKGK